MSNLRNFLTFDRTSHKLPKNYVQPLSKCKILSLNKRISEKYYRFKTHIKLNFYREGNRKK